MTRVEAESLTQFLNRQQDRYEALLLPVGDQAGCILLIDKQGDTPPPPIMCDVTFYLERLMLRRQSLAPELERWLHAWQELSGDTDEALQEAPPGLLTWSGGERVGMEK